MPHAAGLAVGIVLLAAVIAAAVGLARPRLRAGTLKALGLLFGGLLAADLVFRGIAEFWVVDYADPASYRNDWGGPSLAGVFAVHTGPGVLVLAGAVLLVRRRLRKARARSRP